MTDAAPKDDVSNVDDVLQEAFAAMEAQPVPQTLVDHIDALSEGVDYDTDDMLVSKTG